MSFTMGCNNSDNAQIDDFKKLIRVYCQFSDNVKSRFWFMFCHITDLRCLKSYIDNIHFILKRVIAINTSMIYIFCKKECLHYVIHIVTHLAMISRDIKIALKYGVFPICFVFSSKKFKKMIGQNFWVVLVFRYLPCTILILGIFPYLRFFGQNRPYIDWNIKSFL